MAYSKTSARTRKRNKKTVSNGIIYVKSSFNNTIITATDLLGNTLCSASGGSCNFKGSRKGTPYAAQMATDKVATLARDEFGMKTLIIYVRGPGSGRDAALRALSTFDFQVLFIKDDTSEARAFGGCRPPKKRRV